MGDHEDYLPGEAPASHHGSHEFLGTDEINVDSLNGQLADDQPCIAHDLGGDKHIADTLADLNTKVSDADLQDETVLEATMDAKIGTHAALPTVHQNAPALIATHAALPAAHHAKYTDAEARVLHSPVSIHPAAFNPYSDLLDYVLSDLYLRSRSTLTLQNFYTDLQLPNGVTVTKVVLYGNRTNAGSVLQLRMFRNNRSGTSHGMASIVAGWTTGYSSSEDSSISNAVIDNANYTYFLILGLTMNVGIWDTYFSGAKIEFTG